MYIDIHITMILIGEIFGFLKSYVCMLKHVLNQKATPPTKKEPPTQAHTRKPRADTQKSPRTQDNANQSKQSRVHTTTLKDIGRGDTMSTSGDTMSTSGDTMSTSGDTMSTWRGYHKYIGGYHEYIGGYHEYIGRIL